MTLQRQTLRFSDVLSPRRHSLGVSRAPHAVRLTYNARGALFQLLQSFPGKAGDTVLLPAYHCQALVEPVIRAGYRVCFYRVHPDFSIDVDDLASKLKPGVAATIVIHFFGFPSKLDEVADLVRDNGGYLIEDCAHSFLSIRNGALIGQRGDFAIFSYYKFCPSLVGGGLVVNRPPGFPLRDAAYQVPWRERLVLAKRLFEQAAANSPRNPLSIVFFWLDRLRMQRKTGTPAAGGGEAPISAFVDDPYLFREDLAWAAMPGFCRQIVERCDWETFKSVRRRNYQLLSRLVRDTEHLHRPLPELPEGGVPWAFPVVLKDRPRHEQQLRKLGVPLFTFGEVLHSSLKLQDDRARRDAEVLSGQLFLLPVHHQLGAGEIEGFANALNRYVADIEVERVGND